MTDQPHGHEPATDTSAQAEGATARAEDAIRAELPADLTSPRQARSAVRTALAGWGLDQMSDDAELLTSELVANAAEHGDGNPIGLALRRHAAPDGRPGITCEITDTTPAVPRPRQPSPDAERGRGLAIVQALAQSSGVRTSETGKTSWFTLALTDRAHRVAREIDLDREAGA